MLVGVFCLLSGAFLMATWLRMGGEKFEKLREGEKALLALSPLYLLFGMSILVSLLAVALLRR